MAAVADGFIDETALQQLQRFIVQGYLKIEPATSKEVYESLMHLQFDRHSHPAARVQSGASRPRHRFVTEEDAAYPSAAVFVDQSHDTFRPDRSASIVEVPPPAALSIDAAHIRPSDFVPRLRSAPAAPARRRTARRSGRTTHQKARRAPWPRPPCLHWSCRSPRGRSTRRRRARAGLGPSKGRKPPGTRRSRGAGRRRRLAASRCRGGSHSRGPWRRGKPTPWVTL